MRNSRGGTMLRLALLGLLTCGGACGDIEVAAGNGGGDDTVNGGESDTGGIERRVVYDPTGCDPHFAAEVGGRWETYDDREDGGDSRSVLELTEEDVPDGCAMRWVGMLKTVIDEPYGGLELEAPEALGLDQWRTLVFRVRGSGAPVRLEIPREDQFQAALDPDATEDNWNFHGWTFPCGHDNGEWEPVVIDLRALQQEEGWGVEWSRRNDLVRRLRMHPLLDPPDDWNCDFGPMELRRGE